MLDAVLGIFSSGGMGAIVGLVGSIATKWLEYRTIGQKLKYEEKMALIRAKELQLEHTHAVAMADKALETAEVEGAIAADIAAMQAFTESQKVNQVLYGGWIDKIRGLVRPFITGYLLLITTWITILLWNTIGGLESMPQEELTDLFRHLVHAAVFLTITAVTWWFGTRPSEWRKPR